MRKISLLFLVPLMLAASFFVLSGKASGQEIPETDGKMGTIEIINPSVESGEDGNLTISFSAKNNSDNFYSDLVWKFTLLKGGIVKLDPKRLNSNVQAEPFRPMDYVIAPEPFNLSPGQEKKFSAGFDAGNLILAESSGYTYEITVVSKTDMAKYGQWMKPEVELGKTVPAVNFNGAKLVWKDQEFFNLEGINVAAGDQLVARYWVENMTSKDMNIRSKTKIFRRLSTQEKISESESEGYLIPAGKSTKIEFPISNPANLKPDSYLAEVRFYAEDGKQYVPITNFRWVVTGVAGNIISAESSKNVYQSWEKIDLDASITGPADVITSAKLDLIADFYNEKGEKGASFTKRIDFAPSDDMKKIDFSDETYPQSERLSRIVLTLRNGNQVLDSKSIEMGKLAAQDQPAAPSLTKKISAALFLIFALIAFIVLIVAIIKKRKMGTYLFFFVLSFLLLGAAENASAISCPSNNVGFNTNIDISNATITKVDDTHVKVSATFGIMKCWNAADWDFNLTYSHCTDPAVNHTAKVNFYFGDQCATGASDPTGCHWWYGSDYSEVIVDLGERWKSATLNSITLKCRINSSDTEVRPVNRTISNSCPFCGDKIVDPGEQCDDGNIINTDSCISCKNSYCGDGYIRSGVEECDLGSAINANCPSTSKCSLSCTNQNCTQALSVNKNGSGTVKSAPLGIDCGGGGACSNNFNFNSWVTLTPSAVAPWSFSSWGGACSGAGSCVVWMDADKVVDANFICTPTFSNYSCDRGTASCDNMPCGTVVVSEPRCLATNSCTSNTDTRPISECPGTCAAVTKNCRPCVGPEIEVRP